MTSGNRREGSRSYEGGRETANPTSAPRLFDGNEPYSTRPVVLADPAVSKKHAAIRKVENEFELADLGSTNGVYVNGHKAPKNTLAVGDIISVGNTEAVFKRG